MSDLESLVRRVITEEQHKPRRRAAKAFGHNLYAIMCIETRRTKIGCTGNLGQRFDTLQACSPTRLVVYGHAAGLGFLEPVLHEFYAADRLHGEWFSSRVTEQIARGSKPGHESSFRAFVQATRAQWIEQQDRRVKEFEWRGKVRTP
jgi:hypothetical protein